MANEDDQQTAPEAKEQVTQDQQAPNETAGTADELPAWAREQISKANAEAAKYRTERNELKTDAQKWAEFQESQKTEVEKINEHNAALESQLAQVTAENQRTTVALKYGLTADDYDLLGTGDVEALSARAEKIAELRKAAANAIAKPPSDVPNVALHGGNGDVDEPEDDAYPAHWR